MPELTPEERAKRRAAWEREETRLFNLYLATKDPEMAEILDEKLAFVHVVMKSLQG